MESVHCFSCYCFPSKTLDFYITNCMHIFCVDCKARCEPASVLDKPKCINCGTDGIRILKMGPNMPDQVRDMFKPISDDITAITKEFTKIYTFQFRQRHHLLSGLTKKEKVFDRIREDLKTERSKKENYKKQLEQAAQMIQAQELELAQLRLAQTTAQLAALRQAPPPSQPPPTAQKKTKVDAGDPIMTPSMVRVFSDSMYAKEREEAAGIQNSADSQPMKKQKMEIPPFLRQKSMTCSQSTKQPIRAPPTVASNDSNFVTPLQAGKSNSAGFTTPANPPHMFPFLKKFENKSGPSSEHRQHSQ